MNNHFRSNDREAGKIQNRSNNRFQRRDETQKFQGDTNPRQVILDVLTSFDKHPNDPERLIEMALHEKRIDHRDRRFVFEVVYGVIRRKLTLDYIIFKYLIEDELRLEEKLIRVLRIGIYQLIYMDRVPDYAAVNETVKLAKADKQVVRFSSVANAIMRNVINSNKIIQLPDAQADLAYRLSIEFSHPHHFIERWMKNFGLSKTKKLLQFNNTKPPIFLRRKLRDISRQQFEADVKTLCEPGIGFMNLYYKLNKALLPENIRMIQHGLCNVQAPSSGWVVAMMDISKGEYLLDVCAAPGGKTALMSELTGDEGTVCAGDIKWSRLMHVVSTMKCMKLNNVYPLLFDGKSSPFNGHFDKILLDAPCTGTGVFNHHPEARWIRTSDNILRMAQIQKELLNAASSLIGSGGIIVYSTCSLEPEENELQIKEFLAKNPSFKLDTLPSTIPNTYIDNNGFLRITPYDHDMDGMFAARLRKM